jgi:hypothetical protein
MLSLHYYPKWMMAIKMFQDIDFTVKIYGLIKIINEFDFEE